MAKLLVAALLLSIVQWHPFAYAADNPLINGTVDVTNETVTADGASATFVTLTFEDEAGHVITPVTPDQVVFSATRGVLEGNVTLSANGEYAALLRAPTSAGVSFISAKVDGAYLSDLARVNFIAGTVPSPDNSVMTSSSSTLPPDGTSTAVIKVHLKDVHGNDIAEAAGSLQLFTTTGSLSAISHSAVGRYEAGFVTATDGELGSIELDSSTPLEFADGTGNTESNEAAVGAVPAMLSLTYVSEGYYEATLTAPTEEGTATITGQLNGTPLASSVEVKFEKGSAPVTVSQVKFSPNEYAVELGKSIGTTLKAVLSNGGERAITQQATYTIADAAVASVDAGGTVTGLKKGSTQLMATYEGFSAAAQIEVTEPADPGQTPDPGPDPDPKPNPDPTPNPGPASPNPVTPPPAAPGLNFDTLSTDGDSGRLTVTEEDVKKGTIVLDLSAKGGRISLTSANIKTIRALNEGAVLVIRSGTSSIHIPAAELDPAAYSKQFGLPEEAITFNVVIREPDEPTGQAIRQAAEEMQAKVLASPIAFDIQVTGTNEQSAFMSTFSQYVTRTMLVEGNSLPPTATGVWWDPARNEFKFVPTSFEQLNGHWTAVMKRQGASVYAVLDRPAAFADIPGHWSRADVELLASKLLVKGRDEETFAPDATITRAEIAALLVRALGLNEASERTPFPDVVAGAWYEASVNTAYRAGLITGYGDGTFRPTQRITREELTAIIVRAMTYTTITPKGELADYRPYRDQSVISGWALDKVQLAQRAGIIQADGSFRPHSDTTRAEAVTMLAKMLKLIAFL
ncbi:S-layer homology domain-containing protein [Paenibacillus aurantiacus]|uniref:S-layer homology domain-containing protein n=1 Tax=Paenibacillus aurantiacus TaxID=1936118 RepID=A0ABV5KQK0_9BACL